jgi:hypothetical protein
MRFRPAEDHPSVTVWQTRLRFCSIAVLGNMYQRQTGQFFEKKAVVKTLLFRAGHSNDRSDIKYGIRSAVWKIHAKSKPLTGMKSACAQKVGQIRIVLV